MNVETYACRHGALYLFFNLNQLEQTNLCSN
jgi:hypothetical protein